MTIKIAAEKHSYNCEYTLADVLKLKPREAGMRRILLDEDAKNQRYK